MTVDLLEHMPFARLLGLTIDEATADRVSARFEVSEALCTTGRIMHGGAIMAVADTLGAVGTTTIESKTNFLGAARLGSTVDAVATPLHLGGRTSVWQTRLAVEDDKPVALVTQTQLVLR